MRVLITGITGFAGRFLAEALIAGGGIELHGLSRSGRWPAGFEHVSAKAQIHPTDLLDPETVRSTLWLVRPEQIYHLAAYTDAGGSFREARAVWDANLSATLNLYEACLSEPGLKPRMVFVSSGAVYGEAGADQPITERTPLRPNSPYAASKAAADLASFQYWAAHQLPIIRVRAFNQVGPGQSTNFALGRFADQLVRMERGELEPVLRVGNLQAERDFTDVRDMVRAYALLMEHGEPGEVYNAASGTSQRMSWFLDRLLEQTQVPVRVQVDPQWLRPVETHHLRVDIDKLRQTTGWTPAFPLQQTLNDLMMESRRVVPQISGQN